MDAGECLYKHFDEWLECKQREGQNIYGVTGLIAVINFIDYMKEKLNASSNINDERNQRTQLYYRKSRVR